MLRRRCRHCSLKSLCLPRSLDARELGELEAAVASRVLHPHELLFRAGDRLSAVYVVRSGSLAVHVEDSSGIEQVVGFYLPGDLVGLDALHDGRHMTVGAALETTNVCAIPYYRLEELCAVMPQLHRQFRRLMGKELHKEHELLLTLGRRNLQQRIAIFLLDLSRRLAKTGCSPVRLRLSMTRQQIASYLGSAPESVSRSFVKLHNTGLLRLRGREVTLLDVPRLRALCGDTASPITHASVG